ncbi:MAG: hypothetical protein KGR26_11045, partial [Cyanobacteria bacterium REEB65]|nr:hypothetical protein [Cyanobacteria bacterium REEB65]
GKHETVSWDLCMAFSWSLALGNSLHMDVGEELWKRFPGVCPYCGHAPCDCKTRKLKRRKVRPNGGEKPHILQEFQEMFARIYPNELLIAAIHLAEEVGEVNEALVHWRGLHKSELYEELILELADVITTIFSVATAIDLNLAVEMGKWFADGCPGCGRNPCRCGFVILKDGVARHDPDRTQALAGKTRRHRRLAIR